MFRFIFLIVVWNILESKLPEVKVWNILLEDSAIVNLDCASSLEVEVIFIAQDSFCSILLAIQLVWNLHILEGLILDLNNLFQTSKVHDSLKLFVE